MKTKLLPPIKEAPEDYARLEELIKKFFRDNIFMPLIREVGAPKKALQNSLNDVLYAIRDGRITYYRGRFTGNFTATTSRELLRLGAQWNYKFNSWDIPRSQLPVEISAQIDVALSSLGRMVARVDARLAQILPENIADKLQIKKIFDTTLWKTEAKILDTIKGVTIAPTWTKEQRSRIATEYTENLDLYIRQFADEEILELRKLMEANTTGGYRYETMIDIIQKRYDVSQNKAKFLARQETNLLTTKFKELRYTDAGLPEYKWGCVVGSKGHEVRPMHKALENKIFRWDTPPITAPTGARNNPGQDFNCRCYARPVVKF